METKEKQGKGEGKAGFPLTPGRYRMHGGDIAVITDLGCFAYGYREPSGTEDFWDLASGRWTREDLGRAHKWDIIERLPLEQQPIAVQIEEKEAQA